MTPKEEHFWFAVLEQTARMAYARGYAEGTDKKAFDDQRYTITKEHRLLIKSELNKYLKRT